MSVCCHLTTRNCLTTRFLWLILVVLILVDDSGQSVNLSAQLLDLLLVFFLFFYHFLELDVVLSSIRFLFLLLLLFLCGFLHILRLHFGLC